MIISADCPHLTIDHHHHHSHHNGELIQRQNPKWITGSKLEMTNEQHQEQQSIKLKCNYHWKSVNQYNWINNCYYNNISLLVIIFLFLWSINCPVNGQTIDSSDSVLLPVTIPTIKGLVGDKVSIPCNINTADCGEVYFVAWTKNKVLDENSETWSRVYMYSESINKPLSELSNRAVFQVSSLSPSSASSSSSTSSASQEEGGGGNLLIEKLKLTDEAYYKCDVTYISVGKCPSLTYIHLEILAAPSRALISFSDSQGNPSKSIETSSNIGPFKEGEEVKLTCGVTGGKPLPKLEWWSVKSSSGDNLNNKIILSASPLGQMDNSSTSLALIKKIDRSDLNRRLYCHVSHESIEPDDYKYDSFVDVDVYVGALNVYIVGPIDEVKENDLITIKCIATASRPHVNIEWFNGTMPMSNVKISEEIYEDKDSNDGTKRTESIMEFYITRYDHLSTIECRAINPAMNEPIKATIQFKVLYSPTIVMEPENGLKLQENQESINIYCTYNSNPIELKRNETRWYKDNEEIDIEASEGRYLNIFSGYPILSIVNVTREHSGTYYCSVENEIGSTKAKNGVRLNIIYRPTVVFRIYPDVSGNMMIKEGDDIQLLCDLEDGNPSNVSKVRWIRTTSEGNEVIINETTQNEIVWLSVDKSLSGNYSCSALNDAGWSELSNKLELDVKFLPSRAQVQQINGNHPVKGEPLILECIVHSLGWPIATEYLWEHDGIHLVDSTESILNITNVTLSTRGNYSCAAISSAGLGAKGYLYVQPMVPPKLIESLPAVDGALFNASQHSVSCRVECDPPCSIKWYLNGSLIDPNSTSSSARTFTIKETQHPEEKEANIFLSIVSTLSWNLNKPLSRETDNSEITCSSTNNIAGTGVESNMEFRVEYPPENLSISPQVVEVIEGKTPEAIRCHSDALPKPYYRWERWGAPIAESSILEIHNPMTQDTGGNYSCVAYNRHGKARIDAVINVLHKPICEISESEIRGTDTDTFSSSSHSSSYIVLICEAIANPSDNLSFQWIIGNSTFTSTNSTNDIVTNQGSRSQIVISPNDESMFGTWNCSVTNSIGSSYCLFTKSAPLVDSRWTMPHLDEKSIILIAGIIAIIIIIFIIILIIMFCRMKSRRAKQADSLAQDSQKPESDRTSTPSSYISHVPSNKGFLPLNVDVIPSVNHHNYLSDSVQSANAVNTHHNQSNHQQLESTPKLPNGDNLIINDNNESDLGANSDQSDNNQHSPSSGISTAKDMYENMPFHRRDFLYNNDDEIKPYLISHQYEEITELTNHLKGSKSNRQNKLKDINSLTKYGPLEQNIVYADLQLTYDENDLVVNNKGYQMHSNLINLPNDTLLHRKNSTPMATIKTLNQQPNQQQLHHYHNPTNYVKQQQQQLANNKKLYSSNRSLTFSHPTNQQYRNHHHQLVGHHLNNPPSSQQHPHPHHLHHHQTLHHNHQQHQPNTYNNNNSYRQFNNNNINNNQQHPSLPLNGHHHPPLPPLHHYHHQQSPPQSSSELSTPSHQIHYASSRISDYAVLRFDKTPSPPSIC
ncbi:uncharacterized protein LOC128390045 isoform X4 [Panonychus citri]|uniref:uncharacterized protein LOC128390045 isoform X4 n=1 Tax=Panonychus citri TaxID=50023 RepID=UPI0023072AAE|nr:uncharacterized protein LOC128390045 isoform X4 [Panonychus citri]